MTYLTNDDFPLLDAHYTALRLGVSKATIKRWVKKGFLKSIIINSRGDHRFTQAEVERVGEIVSSR